MSFPLAVAPSVRTPGLALRVDLLAAAASPGQSAYKSILIASKMSTGTITADTQIAESVAGPDEVATLLGSGSPGHLASKAWFAENYLGRLDVVAPTESTGDAATATITFAFDSGTTVAATRSVVVNIAGRDVAIEWLTGETATQGAAKFVAKVGSLSSDLPVTAGNSSGVSTLTFKLKGEIGNDCPISVKVSGGSALATVTASGATLASGTGVVAVDTALTTISGTEYTFILPAANGNADAANASATSSIGKIKTATDALDEGFAAKLQMVVVGHTGTTSAAKTGTAQHNYGPMEYVLMRGGRSLPCELMAAEAGRRARMEALDPAVNAINTVYRATLYPPADIVSGALTPTQVEDLLQSGVSPVTYTSTGAARICRPISSYFKDANGNADGRLLDVSRTAGTYAYARDIASFLQQEFEGAKLGPDLTAEDDPPPEGVVEPRDIKAAIATRTRNFWIPRGVIQGPAFEQALADGTLIVRINPSDASQADIVIPEKTLPPLAKLSTVVQHVGT